MLRKTPTMLIRAILIACGLAMTLPATAAAVEKGGVLRYVTGTDPNTLDPQFVTDVPTSRIVMNIHETLVYPDLKGELRPVLAESWTVSEDKLTWTFKLRKGVKFHDGTPFNAAAVKFTFDRIKAKETGSPRASVARSFTEVTVLDDHTIQIKTAKPFAPLLAQLSSYNLAIISPAAAKKHGKKYALNPAGTGPFKLESWQAGEKLTLARNDAYWRDPAYLDKVEVRIVPEDSTRVLLLLRGTVDVVANLSPAVAGRVESNSGTKIIKKTGYRTIYLGLNNKIKPFDNRKVRQAVAHAINAPAIVKGILRGIGTLGGSFESPVIPGVRGDLKPYPFDVEKAKALLKEAGFPNGFTTKLYTPTGRYPADRQVTAAIQAQLAKVGIKVTIEAPDWGAYRAALNKGTIVPMFLLGKGSPTGDLDLTLRLVMKSGARMNNFNYADATMDKWIAEQRTLVDPAERKAVLSKILKKVHEDVPAVVLFYQNQLLGLSAKVEGLEVNPNEFVGFYRAWKKK